MNINLDIIIYVCSSIVTIAGALALCLRWLKKYTTTITEDLIQKLIHKHNNHVECNIRKVENTLSSHINTQREFETTIKSILQVLLRERINSAYIYYKEKESIDLHSLYVLENIHKTYKELDGNSFADGQMDVIRRLPTTVDSNFPEHR